MRIKPTTGFIYFLMLGYCLFLVPELPAGSLDAPSSGLIGWWKCDEGSGLSATDSSTNSNAGLLSSNVSWSTGQSGSALSLDGASSVAFSNAPSLQISNGTISAWIKTTNAGSNYRAILAKRNAYNLLLNNNILITYDWNTFTDCATTNNLADNQWHQVAMTFQGGVTDGARLYVDGTPVLTTRVGIRGQTYPVYLGNQSSAAQQFKGLVDEVRIYSRILTPSQIQELFSGIPASDTDAPTTPGTPQAATVTASSVSFSWAPSTDQDGIAGYNIFRNGIQMDVSPTNAYTDNPLSPDTAYTYTVSAYESNGTISAQSGPLSVRTLPTLSAQFTLGQSVTTVGDAEVRAAPGLANTLLELKLAGSTGNIIAGPVSASGTWWWNVDFDAGADGWTAETNLIALGGLLPFQTNDTVQVSSSTINVRASANGTVLGQQPLGAFGVVISGPLINSDQRWWNINFNTGIDGWVSEGDLMKFSASPTQHAPPPPDAPPEPYVGALLEETTTSPSLEHHDIYRVSGMYAQWPANRHIWNWGNEILLGYYVDATPAETGAGQTYFSRSLDGGLTWTNAIFSPQPGATNDLDAIDFTAPNFILWVLRKEGSGNINGFSNFYISTNKGVTWKGPFPLPSFGLNAVAGRTDYLVNGPKDIIAFLSGANNTTDLNEGTAFGVRTIDGGKTWSALGWVGPVHDSDSFYIQPSSVRLPDGRILTALRYADMRGYPDRGYIILYESRDNALSWSFVSYATGSLGGVGNPPSLILLPDQRLVLTYGKRLPIYGAGIRAKISNDYGRTWAPEIILRKDAYDISLGYTRAVVRPDGKIITGYYIRTTPDWKVAPTGTAVCVSIWDPGLAPKEAVHGLALSNSSSSGVLLAWSNVSSMAVNYQVERTIDYGMPVIALDSGSPGEIAQAGTSNCFQVGAAMQINGGRLVYVPPSLAGLPRLLVNPMDYLSHSPNRYRVVMPTPGTVYALLNPFYYGRKLSWMDESWTDTGLLVDGYAASTTNTLYAGWSIWKKTIPAPGVVALGTDDDAKQSNSQGVSYVFSGKYFETLATLSASARLYTDTNVTSLSSNTPVNYQIRTLGPSGSSALSPAVLWTNRTTSVTNTQPTPPRPLVSISVSSVEVILYVNNLVPGTNYIIQSTTNFSGSTAWQNELAFTPAEPEYLCTTPLPISPATAYRVVLPSPP